MIKLFSIKNICPENKALALGAVATGIVITAGIVSLVALNTIGGMHSGLLNGIISAGVIGAADLSSIGPVGILKIKEDIRKHETFKAIKSQIDLCMVGNYSMDETILNKLVNKNLSEAHIRKLLAINLSKETLEKLIDNNPETIIGFLKSISEIEDEPTNNNIELSKISDSNFMDVNGFTIYKTFLTDMTRNQKIILGNKEFKYQFDQTDENYKKIVKEIFTDNPEIFKNDKELVKTLSLILNQRFFVPFLGKFQKNNFNIEAKNASFNITENKNNPYTITYKCDFKIQTDIDTYPKDFANAKLESIFTLSKKDGNWTSSIITSKLKNIQIV
jgi:hypothetical protein